MVNHTISLLEKLFPFTFTVDSDLLLSLILGGPDALRVNKSNLLPLFILVINLSPYKFFISSVCSPAFAKDALRAKAFNFLGDSSLYCFLISSYSSESEFSDLMNPLGVALPIFKELWFYHDV